MPEENKELKDIEGETLQEEKAEGEEKRRIKPVIEEVVADKPTNSEEKDNKEESPDPKSEVKEDEHHDHQNHDHPVYEKSLEMPSEESKSDVKLFVIIAIITAIVVATLAGGIYVYITGTKGLEGTATPTPEATIPPASSPEATPEGSPSAALKLEEYKVQILNGSGKIGEANKAKAMLEKVGFEVLNTGNAKTFDFTDTIIQAKEAVSSEVLDAAESALSKTYSVKIGDSLDSDSDFDLVITIGTK